MDQRETACFGHADDLGKIVPYRGFSAGKLHIARPGSLPEAIHLKGDTLKGRFRRQPVLRRWHNRRGNADCTVPSLQSAPYRYAGHDPGTTRSRKDNRAPAPRTDAGDARASCRGPKTGNPAYRAIRERKKHRAPGTPYAKERRGYPLPPDQAHIQRECAASRRGRRSPWPAAGNGPGASSGSVMSIPYSAHKSTSLSQHSASRSPHKVMSAPPPVFS